MNQNGTYNGLDRGINNGLYNGVDVGALGGTTSGDKPLPSVPLLNLYPNAAAAYSLRRLRTSYTGACIRVRRSSDNAEQDIGFNGNDLDTSALLSFVGANNGFVTIWYSQGTTSNVNFTQTTQAQQPRIVNAGVIDVRNGKPSLFFDGTKWMDVLSSTASFNYLHQAGQAAVFIILQCGLVDDPNIAYQLINNSNGGASTQHGYALGYDDRSSLSVNNAIRSRVARGVSNQYTSQNEPNNFFSSNTLSLITNLLDNSTSIAVDRNILYRNGINKQILNTVTNTASTLNANANMRIGEFSSGTGQPLNGYVSELILYPTDQSFNRINIEKNINNYYKIY